MLQINKVLTLPDKPFQRGVDLQILAAVEKVVPCPVQWVDYKELKPQKGRRRFLIIAAYNQRDK